MDMERKPALIVMAKWPEPGQVKTRLLPLLSAEEACALYRAMLLDVLEAAVALENVDAVLGFWPEERREDFKKLAPRGTMLISQKGADLAARMQHCFDEVFARGYAPVLMRNSDGPTLPERVLRAALEALAGGAQAVFSPDASNGFGVIGLEKSVPKLLGRPLETDNSYEEIRARCADAGLRAAEVEGWYDVDGPADLSRLLRDWRGGAVPRNVRALLDRHGAAWEARVAELELP